MSHSALKYVYRNILSHRAQLLIDVKRGIRSPFLPEMEQKKAIFVHVPKAAGTSISSAIFNGVQVGHFFWSDYNYIDCQKFNEFFKFSFVRNPYDRLVSAFFYLKKGGGNHFDRRFNETYLADINSFDEFLLNLQKNKKLRNWIHFVPQTKFLLDQNNQLQVDYLGRFECIDKDIIEVKQHLSIPCDETLRHENASNRADYSKYYNKKNRELVYSLYKTDFENFEYEK